MHQLRCHLLWACGHCSCRKPIWLIAALLHLCKGFATLSLKECQLSAFLQSAEEERQCMSLSASCQQLPEGIQPVEHPDGSQGACRSARLYSLRYTF